MTTISSHILVVMIKLDDAYRKGSVLGVLVWVIMYNYLLSLLEKDYTLLFNDIWLARVIYCDQRNRNRMHESHMVKIFKSLHVALCSLPFAIAINMP